MARDGSVYRCQECGFASPKAGTCPDCARQGNYVHLVEERQTPTRGRRTGSPPGSAPVRLADVNVEAGERMPTGVGELDRVLGGGVVRGSLVLIGGDPGIGKCVTPDTRILDPLSGAYRPITTWAKEQGAVLAVNQQTLRLDRASVSAFHERGTHPIVEVKTALGRTLRCTPDHALLTPEGWRPVQELAAGSRIAAPRALPYFGHDSMPEAEIKLIAYILSDGSAQSQISVTNRLPEVANDLEEIASAFGMQLVRYEKAGNEALQYRFVNDKEQRAPARQEVAAALRTVKERLDTSWQGWARRAGVSFDLLNAWRRGVCAPSESALRKLADAATVSLLDLAPDARSRAEAKTPIARYLEGVGLRFAKAADKAVPDCIFRLPRKGMALFLKVLFTCDGSVYVNRRGQPGISYSTISRRLAEDVHHLLLRSGLVATLRTKHHRVNGRSYTAYEVVLLGLSNVQHFLATIGIMGRDEACQRIASMESPRGSSTGRDTIPTGPPFWIHLEIASGNATFGEISRRAGVFIRNRRHERPLCRKTVAGLADAFPDPRLEALAYGDVYWDEIASVVSAGEAPVYDLTVPGNLNFVANDLVIHNSTLLFQASRALADLGAPILYVSGEESAAQVKLRADRLGISPAELYLLAETNLEAIEAHTVSLKPRVLVVDSIQTVYLPDLESAPGSVSQVRECGGRLMLLAKRTGVATFLVGHVTKEGALAGPRVLEHLVDTVLYFEGERHHSYRVLRAVKNRFGSTNEIGVFEMTERGLAEVKNPSGFFLSERPQGAPGSVVVSSLEGSRPLLLELQVLVSPASFGTPRRTVLGMDYNRACLLLAVLEKRLGFPLQTQDAFVNVAGGARVVEPAADLGLIVAAASSYLDRPVKGNIVIFGEVGLAGEVRAVAGLEARLREAAALGFAGAMVPRNNLLPGAPLPLEVHGVGSIDEAIQVLLGT